METCSPHSPLLTEAGLAQSVGRLTVERDVAGCRGFEFRGWTNPRVLKITGTSFALQTTGTSRGLGGHVKWWSCFQQETKISDLNKYFQVTSIFSLTITKLRRKLGEKSFP